jgi:hypothetical protein
MDELQKPGDSESQSCTNTHTVGICVLTAMAMNMIWVLVAFVLEYTGVSEGYTFTSSGTTISEAETCL